MPKNTGSSRSKVTQKNKTCQVIKQSLIQILLVYVLDKMLKDIRGVSLDDRKVLSAQDPMTNILEFFFVV